MLYGRRVTRIQWVNGAKARRTIIICVYARSADTECRSRTLLRNGKSMHPITLTLKYNFHSKICTVCGNEFAYGEHEMSQQYNDAQHWEECDVCGYKVRETDHNISYTPNNDGKTHTADCGGCDYEATEEHTFNDWHSGNSVAKQTRECSLCGFSETRDAKYTVTYEYVEPDNAPIVYKTVEQDYGTPLDLTVTASKSGWEFVGWSRQSYDSILTEADNETVSGDVTLYAIFKKTYNVRFYSKNGSIQTTIKATVYNDEKSFNINNLYPDGFNPDAYEDWEIMGWTDGTDAMSETIGDLSEGIIPDVTKDYYAVYYKNISLTCDAGEAYEKDINENELFFNSAGTYSTCQFTLPPISTITGSNRPDFQYWAVGNKLNGEKLYPDDIIDITENTTVYAVYTEDLETIPKHVITYDFRTNGGTSMTNLSNPTEIAEGGILSTANLGEATKEGWEFVGWNTDPNAKRDIGSVTANGDITLYAIYKKDITAAFNMPDETLSYVVVTIYNNKTEATVTLPELSSSDGFTPLGWLMSGDNSAKYYSGTVKISEDKAFTPVYVKYITLTYDTNGSSESIKPQQAVLFKYGSTTDRVTLTLADAPVRDGYEFTGWAVSTDPTKGYRAGETVTLTENAIATAQWSKIELPPEKLTVTYDYKTNGGTNISATAPFASVEKGARADLSFTSTKAGWEFVGWNTNKDAHEALSELTVTEDVTLYAIYKKDITALFYSGENADTVHAGINETLYNNDREVSVTAPLRIAVDGWYFEGWRRDKHAVESEYAAQYPGSTDSIRITFSDNIDFYSVYSRQITITKDTGAPTKSYKQYFNTGGGIESIAYMLSEPAMQYKENEQGETERFAGWEVVTTNDAGEEIVTEQKPGTVVNIDQNTTVRAKYVNVPEGATLPKVETVGSSVISSTQALVIKDVTNDDVTGNDIISQGFVYWSKLGDGTKYTVTTPSTHMALEFLAPGTEYYYYAFAENAAGTSKGYIKSFKTESDGNTPTALTINPEYVSIKKGDKYQLLATLLPVAAENKIFWSSSDPDKVTVDENGMLTAKAAGEGIIITATTEVGRLTAECIVDVTEETTVTEKDFSEWHMASHTYNGAENGFDWDTADADGGNHTIATAYLARWEGAVMESDDQYPAYTTGARPSKTTDEQYHVQNVEWLPAREKITSPDPLANDDEIKSALMEYGAVYTLMCIDWDCFDYTSTNYYCPNEINYNGHAITIVGWDDNYSKENFTGAYKPDKNGAFICKNSWGEDVGENGFFYISYYDACMGRLDSNAVVTGAESKSKTNYNTIYQYDPLGAVGYIGYDDTTYAANVFPENGKSLTKNEYLEAVSFYTYHKNTSYDVYVVTDYKNKASLSQLTTPLASGVIKNSGYHTISLPKAVSLKSGTRFAVVVKLDVPGESSYVYCEYPVYGYSSKAKANADESYFSYDGSYWDDITDYIENGNFCIKAFTDNGAALSSAELYSAIDNENREYDNEKVYTLAEAKEIGMPINDSYEEFVNNKNSFNLSSVPSASLSLGSMPSIIKAGSNSVTYTEGARFPSRYNLAEMGLVSSVKDQGSWGTCWAHAMYASLESCMMRAEMTHSTAAGTPQVILSRNTLTMSEDASVTLAKKITPVSTEDKTVVWTSSDDTVAKVDTNGTIRSLKAGSATISATTVSGGYTGSCSVVVESDTDESEETVTFEEKTVNKEIGDKFMVAYSVTPMRDEAYNYGWISGNPNVATVTENGIIEAKKNGTAEISILSNEGIVKDTVTVVVGDGYNFESNGDDIDGSGLTVGDGTISGTVTTKITSNAVSDNKVTVILAVYDVTELVGFVSANATLHPGSNDITFEDVSFEGSTDDSFTFRIYTWGSAETLLPIAKAAQADIAFP